MLETSVAIKPRLAFVGVGWIGRSRMQAAAESGIATLAAISDPSPECLQEARKIIPFSRVLSFDELIQHPDIDGVVIATPSALHMEQSVAALRSGKAVFCQKPLGRNYEEVATVVSAARHANKLLGADFSYRYTRAFSAIRAVIQSRELGKIFAADLKFHNAYGPGKPWFYDRVLSGGGCALDLGIHLLDLLLLALDFPRANKIAASLFHKGASLSFGNAVEDYANVLLELDNDITAHLTCSWNLPVGQGAVIEISFYGTNGSVSMMNVDGSFYDFAAYRCRGTQKEKLLLPPDNWGGKALLDWIENLSVNSSYNSQAEEYLPAAAILDMIYEKAN